MAQGWIEQPATNYVACWRDADGKKHKKTIGPRKRDAQAFLAKVQTEIAAGTHVAPSGMLFSDFTDLWLERYARGSYATSTLAITENWIDAVLVPALGRKRLDKITTLDLQAFIDELPRARGGENELTPATRKRYMNTIRSMFGKAVEWKMLQANPSTAVTTPKASRHKELRVLTPAELKLFLGALPEDYLPLFKTLAYTGIRLGEALALEWEDIDLKARTIRVNKSVYKKTVGPTKTQNSLRTVSIPPSLVKNLVRGDSKLVFPNQDGTYFNQHNLRHRIFQPTCLKVGLAERVEDPTNKSKKRYVGLRIHDLRHTFASIMIANGETALMVKQAMGHGSINTTFDVYGHLFPDDKHAASDRFDEAVA